MFKLRLFILFSLLFIGICAQKKVVVGRRSKLCLDVGCNEVLYKAKVVRSSPSTHHDFLDVTPDSVGKYINVVAVKFSDRVDIAEGKFDDGSRGIFYLGAVEKGSYVEFLRDAIETKKELHVISQDSVDIGEKRIVGFIHAENDLVRDFNVASKNYAIAEGLPEPTPLPVPEVPAKGHGHSHDHGHGHSHGNGHSHDHGHSHEHFHSHEPPAVTAAPAVATPPPIAQVPVQQPVVEKVQNPVLAPRMIPLGGVQANPVGNVPPVIDPKPVDPVATPTPVTPPVTKTPVGVPVTPPVAATPPVAVPPSVATEAPATPPPVPVTPTPVVESLDDLEKMMVEDEELARMIREDNENIRLLQEEAQKAAAAPVDPVAAPAELPPPVPLPVEDPPTTTAPVTPQETVPEIIPVPEEVVTTTPTPVEASVAPVTEATPMEGAPVTEAPVVTPPVVEPVPTTTAAPEIVLPQLVDIPYKFEEPVTAEPTTTPAPQLEATTPEPVPQDPKPTEVEAGYCLGDDCSKYEKKEESHQAENTPPVDERKYAEGEKFDYRGVPPPSNKGQGVIGSMISIVTGSVRAILGDMSDGQVGLFLNFTFVVGALLIYFLSSLCSDSGDSVVFDRREDFNLSTRCKALLEELNKKDAELSRLSANAGRSEADAHEINDLRVRVGGLEIEYRQSCERLKLAEQELERERSAKADLEQQQEDGRKAINTAEQKAREFERQLQASQKAAEEYLTSSKVAKNALERFENDLKDARSLEEQLRTEVEKTKAALKRSEDQVVTLNGEVRALTEDKHKLEMECTAMVAMIEEQEKNKKETEAESGGSGGWSDFGDEPEVEEREKTPPTAVGVDVRELAKLKAQLKKLETDYEQAQKNLERDLADKVKMEDTLSSLRIELERKAKEAELRDSEKRDADSRVSKLMDFIEGNNSKIQDLEAVCERLRDEVQRGQVEIGVVQEEKRKKDDRVKELDTEMKHWKNEFQKLENKSFHKDMEYAKRLRAAEALAAAAPPPMEMVENQQREGAPSRGAPFQSMWDQPADPVGISRSRTFSPDDEFMSAGLARGSKSTRSRRSDRMVREPSPSDLDKRKEKKEGVVPRRRSRSHGRQVFTGPMGPMPPYIPGGPGYHPVPMEYGNFGEPLNRRHSRSGHVYYSSGGSNGGRSPPPEMPSGFAPPPVGVRKPSSRRAVDMNDFKSP